MNNSNGATRLVCLEAAQKLRTYVGIYTGDKQARRLIDELLNIAAALAAPAATPAQASSEFVVYAKRAGLVLTQPTNMEGENGEYPATYFDSCTEAAWRAWANKPAAQQEQAKPTDQARELTDAEILTSNDTKRLDFLIENECRVREINGLYQMFNLAERFMSGRDAIDSEITKLHITPSKG